MARPSVLRIGGPHGSETSINILKTELSKHFDERQGCLCIENKYFTAQVQLAPFDISAEGCDEGNKEDGVLLMFPHSTQIDTLTELHDNLHNTGENLRLCISTSVGSIPKTKENDKKYSERVLWCLDRGYEYIEVDLSGEGLKRDFDKREKDGFARVVEAMGGIVWSSAVMSTRGKKKSINVSPADIKSEGSCKDDNQNKDAKESVSKKKVTEDAQIEAVQDLAEKKNEELLDNIESVMKDAKKIRDASKAGDLSDAERRQRAGDAATLLMGLLDEMGFDDDDCSSDDE